MDLNYLFHRQQVERAKAESAQSEAASAAHSELAARYELRINQLTSGAFAFEDEDRPAAARESERHR